ncbi:hypothetical protein [Clostridium sartagoforme]|uniref:HNH endonuclease n=1 Tax=Clostridium sartagoforme TaxID=84031 RepID=UPI0031DA5C55
MNSNSKLETWFGKMTFDYKHCFLCGEILNKQNYTVEHIFPKWLQHRHNLWNQNITLLNGTLIKYKQLVVPCCKDCNNNHLAKIEKEVKDAFEKGIEEVRALDKTILYKWIMKILYCLLFKQLSLKEDIRNKDSTMIISSEILKEYTVMFDYMQSILGRVKIREDMGSIFIFSILPYYRKKSEYDYYYIDDVGRSQVALMSNGIGIICCLNDSEAMKYRFRKYFKPFYDIKLHNIQFRQLIADVFYNRSLLKNKQSIMTVKNNNRQSDNLMIQIPPHTDYYDEYNYKNYAMILYFLLREFGFKFEELYDLKNDAVRNLLIDSKKRIIVYDEDNRYYLGEEHKEYNAEVFNDDLLIKKC